VTERKYPVRDSGPMYNFPMPTETLRAELAEAKAMIDAALRLHKPQRRYTTPDDFEASYDDPAWIVEAFDIPIEKVESFAVCEHCGSIEMRGSVDYRESLWPCDTAKALGVTE
jgi:hypothetical protein